MNRTALVTRMSLLLAPLLLAAVLPVSQANQKKMKPEELVAKHLASIGAPEALAAAGNRVMEGDAMVIFRLGSSGQLVGNGSVVSASPRIRVTMQFPHPDYPGEQLAYDGDDVKVGMLRPGLRSALSQFIYDQEFLLREGLIGGATSVVWSLLDTEERRPRLDYRGIKKQDDRELHELGYRARKGSGDVKVYLYFEPETFRHVLTTYVLRIPASMGRRPQDSAAQRDTYWRVREEYEDFRAVDGLTIPHAYKLILTYEGQNQTSMTEWRFAARQVRHNQTLPEDSFKVN